MIVVGSLNADLVLRVRRVPRPGETVVAASLSRAQGGKGANQAAAAALLGARTRMIGRVGEDDAGREALRSLEARGVDCSEVRTSAGLTGLAVVVVEDGGENAIVVAPGANGDVLADEVARAVTGAATPASVVLACLEVPLEAVTAAAVAARARGARVVLDPAPARPLGDELLALCDVLTPNRGELEVLASGGPDGLLARGARAVVVTLGEEGAVLYREGLPPLRQPPFAVTSLDATGAGDAFNGTLGWALASGRDLETAVRLAAAGGALAARRVGARASLGTAAEVEGLASQLPER